MAKKEKEEALEPVSNGGSGILALSNDGATEFKQIIDENFGGNNLTLADLDKIKIPSGQSAAIWSIPSVDNDETTAKTLEGVIIGWADKKSWWHKSFNDSEGNEQPDCKSNDMVHGVGNPNMFFNSKEQEIMDAGKGGKAVRDAAGWLCSTCIHNQFGTAAQGGGKACQDKRFILFLLKDSVIPILIRVPATSINNFKQYFKRLAGSRKSYLSVVTGLDLEKVKGKIDYYVIVPKALSFLTPEDTTQVRSLREPFQAALDAEDAVEQGYIEKDAADESLEDMPTDEAAAGNDPF